MPESAAAPIVMKVIEHHLGSTTSNTEVRPRGYGVPPPLPGRDEPQKGEQKGDPSAKGKTKADGKAPPLPGRRKDTKGGAR